MSAERILFLYLATGGGHSSAAKALSREVARIAGPSGAECFIFNGLGDSPSPVKMIVEDGYTTVSTRYPWIWPILYNMSHYSALMRFQTDLMRLACADRIGRAIKEKRITRVVLLHFLLVRPVTRALVRIGKSNLPVLTVVTDPFTTHNLWSFKQRNPIIVFSEEARRRVQRRLASYAVDTKNPPPVKVCPPILDIKFGSPLNKIECDTFRDEQGFSRSKPLILLAGGGEGLPAGETYLKALLKSGIDFQLAMVCGKNQKQFAAAQAIAEADGSGRARIYGFVSIMYELMNAADIIVTKGGPATLFEVLSLKKPLVITRYLYGQEQGNVDFVMRRGLGWYEPKPRGLVKRIAGLLDKPADFGEVRSRLEKTHIGIGTEQIARIVLGWETIA